MATILLSAAGFALGASTGGSVLGLSLATIGRAVGAVVGRSIDERLLGSGSAPVETGRVDRFRLTGASEGAPLAQVHGRMRIGGQVIWATRFLESSETSGGGKGGPRQAKTVAYSYSVSLALALCAGEITRVGRVWADGVEIARDDLNMRVYLGSETQLPDPKMEAVEGAGRVPAYRGMAYVVLEDLPLAQFGNRVPQFSFEVFRPSAKATDATAGDLARLIKGVAMIPGTGEYALATTPVFLSREFGEQQSMNVNTASGKTDFAVAIEALDEELPECQSVSLVVSWFGNDLRAGQCTVRPKVEQDTADAAAMPWVVTGLTRGTAQLVPQISDRPVYGGTPADASVIESIVRMRELGKDVMFYPFVLMDQLAGNTLTDPWTGGVGQPPLPWRGRITTVAAPGRVGSTDGTAAAAAEVAAFFGAAQPSDFVRTATGVVYSGPAEWSLRRFILHYANLSVVAGGVKAFCIGSEMRSLTQIRGAGGSFPADCRADLQGGLCCGLVGIFGLSTRRDRRQAVPSGPVVG
jgi:GTA TIM-barrel-like domain